MPKTACTAARNRAAVVLSALSLIVVALVAGPATTLGHGADVTAGASASAQMTVDGSVPCGSCGG